MEDLTGKVKSFFSTLQIINNTVMTCFKYSSELIYEKYKNLIIHDFEVILKL